MYQRFRPLNIHFPIRYPSAIHVTSQAAHLVQQSRAFPEARHRAVDPKDQKAEEHPSGCLPQPDLMWMMKIACESCFFWTKVMNKL